MGGRGVGLVCQRGQDLSGGLEGDVHGGSAKGSDQMETGVDRGFFILSAPLMSS